MNWKRVIESRPGRWSAVLLLWTAIVLFYSTSSGRMGMRTTWSESVRFAAAQWYVWALLAPLIIRFDRSLPVPREAFLGRVLLHIPASFGFTVLYTYLSAWVRSLLVAGGDSLPLTLQPLSQAWRGAFHWNILVYWVITGAYTAYVYHANFRERQLRTVELERLLAEAKLDALRTQLHPHFLFNALNAISAYVERDPKTARRMLEQLGELLRLSLDHCEDQEIPLERELAFLDRYLAIQRVRFEDRLDASVEADPEALDAMVPTFILQPLVENSIRHGIAQRSLRGSISVEAWRDNGSLRLRVVDDGPGLPAGWDPASNKGLGLSNTRERLRRLYGESDQSFRISNQPGGGACVEIRLPLRRANNGHGDTARTGGR